MNKLFIELYLDEDVDVLLAKLVSSKGFSVLTTSEAGQLGKSDEEQFKFAISKGRVMFTHNRVDFEKLVQHYFEKGETYPGVIIAMRRPVYEIERRLLLILNQVTADEMIHQVRYI